MTRPAVVIFGTNNGALSVARHLCRRTTGPKVIRSGDILFVDNVQDKIDKAAQQGYAVTLANYLEDDDLKGLGIGAGVTTLFCLMSDESANVFLALSARALDSTLTIIAVSESEHSAARLRAAGANSIISPHASTARRIYSLLRKPLIVDLLEHTVFGNANLDVAEILLPEGCNLLGQRLRDLDINQRFNLIPVDVVHTGNATDRPVLGTRGQLQAGDILIVIGSAESLAAFQAELQA